eukprot:Skav222698  [mRNA]  locus=scaffold402:350731:355598:+ [translate_table: standard]
MKERGSLWWDGIDGGYHWVTEEKAYGSDNDYDGGESDDDVQEFHGCCHEDIISPAQQGLEQEKPSLAERQSERQARRYQDPPNKWLLDGIVTGEQAAFVARLREKNRYQEP